MYSIHSLPSLLRTRRVPIRFAALLVALTPGLTFSATLRVPTDYPSIQGAINAASSGDSILIGPGTYLENLDLLGKTLTVRGAAGAAATTIDGGQLERVILMNGGGVLEGLTVQNGRTQHTGGGIQVEGTAPAVLQDLVVRDNVVGAVDIGRGGGVFLSETTAGVIVRRTIVANNYAGASGGGVYDGGTTFPGQNRLENNELVGNGCHVSGGGIRLGTASAVSNVLRENWSDSFGGGISGGGAEIRNNTVVANFTNNSFINGAGIHLDTKVPIVSHNIVALNHGPLNALSGAGVWAVGVVSCNDSWGNDGPQFLMADTTAAGNFSLDPVFCDPSTADYSISIASPCAPGASACGLIGALNVTCAATPTRLIPWGRLKAKYAR